MNVLLVIDMLNDFMKEGGALYCGDDARGIIPFLSSKIEECRKGGGKVIYLCDAHAQDDEEFAIFHAHSVKGTIGAKIIDELKPRRGDIVIEKTTLSAFYKTKLERVLKKLKPQTVYVAGVCTSICIMDAVGDLRNRGYKVVVYKDGIADFNKEAEGFAIKRMKDVYGAVIE